MFRPEIYLRMRMDLCSQRHSTIPTLTPPRAYLFLGISVLPFLEGRENDLIGCDHLNTAAFAY